MCNHKYKPFKEFSKNEFCNLEDFFSQDELPHDAEGKCIFHSKDLLWKRKNGFYSYLVNVLSAEHNKSNIDLRETHFISKKRLLEIDYLQELIDVDFTGSTFHSTIFMGDETGESIDIEGKLDFIGCTFLESVFIENCQFKNEVFFGKNKNSDSENIISIQFNGCVFENNFIYSEQLEYFTVYFSLYACDFKKSTYAHFENINSKHGSFDLSDCSFHKFNMINTIINAGIIDFSEIEFHTAIFENTQFKGETNFNSVKIGKKLSFIGSPEKRIFYGNTHFDILEKDIEGVITFIHTNIFLIEKKHRERLMHLSHQGKVNIEEGCIKYRLQTEKIFIKADKGNQNIIQELTHTFTSFISSNTSCSLGVEILDRTEGGFSLFYFTDANMSEEDFFGIFTHHQNELFQILGNYKGTMEKIADPKIKINYFMTRVSLLGSLCKCSVQIGLNLWKKETTLSLLNSIMLKGQKLLVEGEDFHENLTKIDISKVISSVNRNDISSNIHVHGNIKHLLFIQNNQGEINNFTN